MMNQTISIAKGIGIILMVVGHSGCPESICIYIYLFHLPLFFIVSGYCFKDSYLATPKEFVKRRVSTLYFPYLKWSVLFIAMHNLLYSIGLLNTPQNFIHFEVSSEALKTNLFNIVNLLAFHWNEALIGPIWFLSSLFAASLTFYTVCKVFSNRLVGAVLLLLVAMGIYGLSNHTTIAHVFVAALMIMLGHMYKKEGYTYHRSKSFILLASLVLLGAIQFIQGGILNLNSSIVIPYIIVSTLGTLMVLGVSYHIYSLGGRIGKCLIFIGQHTMPILIWHTLCFKVVSVIKIATCTLPVSRLCEVPTIARHASDIAEWTDLWYLAYTLVGVGLPLFFVYVKERFSQFRDKQR